MKPSTKTDSAKTSMESLALPQELYWNGKTEPISPPSLDLFAESTGHWLYDDNFANEIILANEDTLELKPGLEFSFELINGDDLVVELCNLKEEYCNDVKLQATSPQLLDYPIETVISHPNPVTKVHAPFDIENFGTHGVHTELLTQLTPPQSPPQNVASPPAFPITSAECQNHIPDVLISELNEDVASGIVDAIVRNRAQELPDWNDDCQSQTQTECTTDEEWMTGCGSSSSSIGSSPIHLSGSEEHSPSSTPKKRTRPYGRGIEDRKIRKKEQNKNAATRYRQKKKLEMEHVLSEEQQLTQRNEELKRDLAERRREAKYLKTLIREFYQKKK